VLHGSGVSVARLLQGSSKIILAWRIEPVVEAFPNGVRHNLPCLGGTVSANCTANNDLTQGGRRIIEISSGA